MCNTHRLAFFPERLPKDEQLDFHEQRKMRGHLLVRIVSSNAAGRLAWWLDEWLVIVKYTFFLEVDVYSLIQNLMEYAPDYKHYP